MVSSRQRGLAPAFPDPQGQPFPAPSGRFTLHSGSERNCFYLVCVRFSPECLHLHKLLGSICGVLSAGAVRTQASSVLSGRQAQGAGRQPQAAGDPTQRQSPWGGGGARSCLKPHPPDQQAGPGSLLPGLLMLLAGEGLSVSVCLSHVCVCIYRHHVCIPYISYMCHVMLLCVCICEMYILHVDTYIMCVYVYVCI